MAFALINCSTWDILSHLFKNLIFFPELRAFEGGTELLQKKEIHHFLFEAPSSSSPNDIFLRF